MTHVDSTQPDRITDLLIEQPLVGVYVIQNGRFTYVNERFADVFGYSSAEILALPSVGNLVAPEHRARVAENIARRIEGKTDKIQYSFEGRHRDGSTLHLEVHGARVGLAGGPGVMGVLIDRTEGVKAERHALHLQKLEAAGRLAAGIAHDFKNVLAAIRGTAELLRLDTSNKTEWAEDLDSIISAADRGTRLSKQLMDLNLENPAQVVPLSVAEHVSSLRPMLAHLVRRGISLDMDLAPGLQPVLLDRDTLSKF